MIRFDAVWLAVQPLDMRLGTVAALARGSASSALRTRTTPTCSSDCGSTLQISHAQFDALVLGLPWQRLGEAGIIRVI